MSKIDEIKVRIENGKEFGIYSDRYEAYDDIKTLLTHIDSLEEQLSDFKGLYENSKEQRREIIALKQKLAKANILIRELPCECAVFDDRYDSCAKCSFLDDLARTTLAEIEK